MQILIGNLLYVKSFIELRTMKPSVYQVGVDYNNKNNNNNNNIAFFSQASWGRLEMKPERNKFKVQAH